MKKTYLIFTFQRKTAEICIRKLTSWLIIGESFTCYMKKIWSGQTIVFLYLNAHNTSKIKKLMTLLVRCKISSLIRFIGLLQVVMIPNRATKKWILSIARSNISASTHNWLGLPHTASNSIYIPKMPIASYNPFATVIVFFVDFCVCPTIIVSYRITPHSRVAYRYLRPLPFQMKIKNFSKWYFWVPSVLKGLKSVFVPTVAKYALPQRWQILRKQFLEASDWFTA